MEVRMKAYVNRTGAAFLLGGTLLLGCVPMTLSHEANIDFEAYPSVGVDVTMGGSAVYYGEQSATAYLVRELREVSGFQSVTSALTEEVSLVLRVHLVMLEVVTYYDDTPEFEYRTEASFMTLDNLDNDIDSGSVTGLSSFPAESVEGALQDVAHHYFRPYRL
jgi:hypothetical protein